MPVGAIVFADGRTHVAKSYVTFDLSQEVPVGTTVQFTFHAVLPGSTTFTYNWEDADPVTVPVGTDGTATVTLTADEPGDDELVLFSTRDDGVQSDFAFADVIADPPSAPGAAATR